METLSRDDLTGPEFEDACTDATAKIIEAKREHRELPVSEPQEPGKVLDLLAALNGSVQQAKASRGEDADMHEVPCRASRAGEPFRSQH